MSSRCPPWRAQGPPGPASRPGATPAARGAGRGTRVSWSFRPRYRAPGSAVSSWKRSGRSLRLRGAVAGGTEVAEVLLRTQLLHLHAFLLQVLQRGMHDLALLGAHPEARVVAGDVP